MVCLHIFCQFYVGSEATHVSYESEAPYYFAEFPLLLLQSYVSPIWHFALGSVHCGTSLIGSFLHHMRLEYCSA